MSNKTTKRQREWYQGKAELRYYYEGIGISRFKWDGLPKEIPPFLPEQTLYRQGLCCMMELPGSDRYGIFPVAYNSISLDLYGYPESWSCYVLGDNAIADEIRNKVLTKDDSVLIWNNPSRTGLSKYVDMCINKMLETDMTISTNVMVQNTPLIFNTSNGKNFLTAKNLLEMYKIEPAVFRSDFGREDIGMDVINPGVAFIGDKLSDQYETYNNRIMRYLGVTHLPVEKQERMLTGEVNSGDDQVYLTLQERLNTRKYACEQINKLWGLSVSVEINEDESESEDMGTMQQTLRAGGASGDAGEKSRGEQ